MDLTQRKYINNNKDLLKFDKGLTPFQQRLQANGATALTSTVGFVGNLANAGSYNKTVDDLNTQAGQSSMSTGGYGYQAQNAADTSKEMSEVSAQNTASTLGLVGSGASAGAAIGSLAGPVGGLIGGAVGAVGGLIGGIFGGKSRARKAKEALMRQQREAAIQTEFNRARANTNRLSDKYAEENGFDATQYLNSGFAKGKQPEVNIPGYHTTDSKLSGKEVYGHVNPLGIVDFIGRVPGKKDNKDSHNFAGGKDPGTFVITNKYGLSDIAMEDPETAIALQGALKENGMLGRNKQGYKCGKLPKYYLGRNLNLGSLSSVLNGMQKAALPVELEQIKYRDPSLTVNDPALGQTGLFNLPIPETKLQSREPSLTANLPMLNINKGDIFKYPNADKMYEDYSKKNIAPILKDQENHGTISPKRNSINLDWLPNAISSGATSLAGLGQYLSAKGQSVYKPNSYIPNPNKGKAMNILAGLRPNELPIINGLTDAQAKAMYALDNAGGMSGAQKYLARVGMLRNTQKSVYDALAGLQGQYNQMRSQYANSLLSSGAQEAANMMNANKYDTDIYMRGHAARQQGMQTGIQNMIAGLQQGIANADKLNRFNKMYSLYATA